MATVCNGFVVMERSNIHNRDNNTPSQFQFAAIDKPDPSTIIQLIFNVRTNEKKVQEVLLSVSDPASSLYGKHLTKQEVDDLAANPESLEATKTFLNTIEGVQLTEMGDKYHIGASATVSNWEKALKTTFFNFEKTDSQGERKFTQTSLFFVSSIDPSILVFVYFIRKSFSLS